jgi:hypothetical protein
MMEDTSPPSKRAALATGLALVVAGTFGFLLFSGEIPGLKPSYTEPKTVTVDGRPYFWENYYFPWPVWPGNTTSPSNVTFDNASFAIWVTGWYGFGGGTVHGTASEPNGSSFPFVLGSRANSTVGPTLFVSPDDEVGASWSGPPYVELLVLDRAAA